MPSGKSSSHSRPWCRGGVNDRLRVSFPSPQGSSHSLQSLHVVASQSTGSCVGTGVGSGVVGAGVGKGVGQASRLHARSSSSSGHSSPPCSAPPLSTSLLLVCDPPPHVKVQSPHCPQEDTSQSLGQGNSSQVPTSFLCSNQFKEKLLNRKLLILLHVLASKCLFPPNPNKLGIRN